MHLLWLEFYFGSFLGFLPQFTVQMLCSFTSETAELFSLLAWSYCSQQQYATQQVGHIIFYGSIF